MSSDKIRILMVCLGNICRSPLAEALLRKKVDPNKVTVDSAGLGSYHVGEPPCQSSQDIAKEHGLDISKLKARAFRTADFDKFDKIYIMDDLNWEMIQERARNENDLKKVDFILNEIFPNENMAVPDSYEKGRSAAKLVYDMLDQATTAITKKIQN